MPLSLNRLIIASVLMITLVASSQVASAAGPPGNAPSPFGELVVPPDPPASLFEERIAADLTTIYGSDFTDATLKSVRCPAAFESYDRYTGLTRVCPFEFGRPRVRWSGAITFYSDASPATAYGYEYPKATPYGLRERYCRPNRTWTVRKGWRIVTLAASRRAGDVPGCEDATIVLRYVTARGTTRRVPRATRVENAYSPYGIAFGEGSNSWACRRTGPTARPTITCAGRLGRTFTAALRPSR